MKKMDWFSSFSAAMTITDEQGVIVDMNDCAADAFKKDGGLLLIGKSVFDCHPEPSKTKLRHLYEDQSINAYFITKNGQKKLIYQALFSRRVNLPGLSKLFSMYRKTCRTSTVIIRISRVIRKFHHTFTY